VSDDVIHKIAFANIAVVGYCLHTYDTHSLQQEKRMQIQINTDNNVEGREERAAEISDVVSLVLMRFSDHITRVEVHIADENGPKGGDNDIRCTLEARLEGRQPIAVTHHANEVLVAVNGAAHNLVTVIDRTLGRTEARRRAEQQERPM
jgi:ribosome-associated translation inhibitor RaiA